jgi:hypothetical protein
MFYNEYIQVSDGVIASQNFITIRDLTLIKVEKLVSRVSNSRLTLDPVYDQVKTHNTISDY